MAKYKTLSDAFPRYGSLKGFPNCEFEGLKHTFLIMSALNCENTDDGFFLVQLGEAGLIQDFVLNVVSKVDANPTLIKFRPFAHYAACLMAGEYVELIYEDRDTCIGMDQNRHIEAISDVLSASGYRFLGEAIPKFGEQFRADYKTLLEKHPSNHSQLVIEWMYRPIPWPTKEELEELRAA